jgi:ribosomal protein S27AE
MFEALTDVEMFQQATDGYRYYNERCPRCGALGRLSPHGDYCRWLVFFSGNHAASQRVRPLRFECASCGATHALLPDILTPYSSYSLRFKLAVLRAYFERDATVVAICGRFGIAVSTLYKWKELFLSHMRLMLGMLTSQKESALAFLRGLFGSHSLSERLRSFCGRHGFSFMQNRSTAATRSHPP